MPDKYCTVVHRINVPPVSDNTAVGWLMRLLLSDLRYGRDQSDSTPVGRIVTRHADNIYADDGCDCLYREDR